MVRVEAHKELKLAIPGFIDYLRENCPLTGEAKIRLCKDNIHVLETWYSDICYSGPEGESLLGWIRILQGKGQYDYVENPSSIFIYIYRGVIPRKEEFYIHSVVEKEGYRVRKDPNLEIPVRH